MPAVDGDRFEQLAEQGLVSRDDGRSDALRVRSETHGLEQVLLILSERRARAVERSRQLRRGARARLAGRAVRQDRGSETAPRDDEDRERDQDLRVDGKVPITAPHRTTTETMLEPARPAFVPEARAWSTIAGWTLTCG